jgi:hypothetical protein
VEGSFENGNETSGSIKCWEVLEWLLNWRLLKKGSAPQVSKYNPQNKVMNSLNALNERFLSFFYYSTTLSVSRLYRIGDRMVNEYGGWNWY